MRQQQHAQAGEALFTKQVLPVVSSDESEAGVLAASRRNHLASTETSRSKRDLMTAPAAITPILPRSRGPERAYRATTGAQHMCHNPSRAVLTQDRAGFTGSANESAVLNAACTPAARDTPKQQKPRSVGAPVRCCSNVGHQPFRSWPMRAKGGIGQ